MKFSIKDFFSKCDTEEILNGKLHFLCSALHGPNNAILNVSITAFVLNCVNLHQYFKKIFQDFKLFHQASKNDMKKVVNT